METALEIIKKQKEGKEIARLYNLETGQIAYYYRTADKKYALIGNIPISSDIVNAFNAKFCCYTDVSQVNSLDIDIIYSQTESNSDFIVGVGSKYGERYKEEFMTLANRFLKACLGLGGLIRNPSSKFGDTFMDYASIASFSTELLNFAIKEIQALDPEFVGAEVLDKIASGNFGFDALKVFLDLTGFLSEMFIAVGTAIGKPVALAITIDTIFDALANQESLLGFTTYMFNEFPFMGETLGSFLRIAVDVVTEGQLNTILGQLQFGNYIDSAYKDPLHPEYNGPTCYHAYKDGRGECSHCDESGGGSGGNPGSGGGDDGGGGIGGGPGDTNSGDSEDPSPKSLWDMIKEGWNKFWDDFNKIGDPFDGAGPPPNYIWDPDVGLYYMPYTPHKHTKANKEQSEAARRSRHVDPLVLDLNGDGIETTGLDDGAYFDMNADGFAERTGWVGGSDGMLALDVNGNGIIDNGSELISDQMPLDGGGYAPNGYDALSSFDDNDDGVIDASDAVYSELLVWQDQNSNGISEEGELHSLAELGIVSIGLNPYYHTVNLENGNVEAATGSYTLADGTTGQMGEYLLEANPTDSIPQIDIEIPEYYKSLPDLRSAGIVYTLHQAMAMDTTGDLSDLVFDFRYALNEAERYALIDQIIELWAGVSDVAEGSRGANIDAKQLAVVEKITGEPFVGVEGANPIPEAAPFLQDAYESIRTYVYNELSMQTDMRWMLDEIMFAQNEDGYYLIQWDTVLSAIDSELSYDPHDGYSRVYKLLSVLQEQMSTQPGYEEFLAELSSRSGAFKVLVDTVAAKEYMPYRGYYLGSSGSDTISETGLIFAGSGDDIVTAGAGSTVFGNTGDDTITAGAGSTVFGDIGDDTITAGNGSTVFGGTGNDALIGGVGNHTYVFDIGDGQDIITDNGGSYNSNVGTDKIILGEGIAPEDVLLARSGNDLILKIGGSGDQITVTNHFASVFYQIEQIIFSEDGTVWDSAYLYSHDFIISGTESDDVLTGSINDQFYASQTIIGGAGDDTITTGSATTTVYGGTGDDTITGGVGNHTYVFNLGDGQDTITDNGGSYNSNIGTDKIILGEGIAPEDVLLARSGNDLILRIGGSGDQITVTNHFASVFYQIEQIIFSEDETVWDSAYLYSHDFIISGTESDDVLTGSINDQFYASQTIIGGAGDDIITTGSAATTVYGGTGDDTITGGVGNHTYVFDIGDGQDTITDNGSYYSTIVGTDKIVFGEGIASEDVLLLQSGSDLILKIGDGTDQITVKNHFVSNAYQIENIMAGSYTLAQANVNVLVQAMASFEATYGMSWEQGVAEDNDNAQSILQNAWVTAV
jgi:hypothetical protein